MPDHAKLSPSSAIRWMKCPGSIREGDKYRSENGISSEAAIDGTHTHTLLEHCIKNGANPLRMVGIKLSDHEGDFLVDEDRAKRVSSALEFIELSKSPDSRVLSESKVVCGEVIGRDDIFGTCDVQIISGGVLHIIDYKDGHRPVASDSPQLKLYASGALSQRKDTAFEEVKLTVIQPRIGSPKTVTTTPFEILNFMQQEVLPAATATSDPDAPLVAGEHCRYCPAAGKCAAQAEQALKGAQLMFEHIELAQQSADKEPNTLTDEQIREILEAEPMINEFLKSVRSEALRRFETGHPISGMKMVYSGRANRDWNMSEEETALALAKLGIPKAHIYQKKLLSPAQAEKLTWETRVHGEVVKKSLTDRKIQKMNDELVTKGKGSKMIVPESDRREAIHTDVNTMFAEVEQTPAIPSWLQ